MADPQKWHPDSPETADHSLPYVTLTALLDGTVTSATMQRERWSSPDVVRLLPKVEVFDDPDMTSAYPTEMSARVEVELEDETLTAESTWPRGHARNPISDDDLLVRAAILVGNDKAQLAMIRGVLTADDGDAAAGLWQG
jgi:2-methylcitrate dehydratase